MKKTKSTNFEVAVWDALTPEEKAHYEVYEETRELSTIRCTHKKVTFDPVKHALICPECGAGWSGPRLGELEQLLKNQP